MRLSIVINNHKPNNKKRKKSTMIIDLCIQTKLVGCPYHHINCNHAQDEVNTNSPSYSFTSTLKVGKRIMTITKQY
jgi:hypothetical protein